MMHPPALSGENAGIQKAFEKAVNDKNIVMKTPTTGDYRSSFILYDFDGDGEEIISRSKSLMTKLVKLCFATSKSN